MKNCLILSFFILAFLVSCGKKKDDTKLIITPNAVDESEIIAVKTVPVVTRKIVHDVVGTGMLMSKSESRLSFKTGGVISKVYVKEGDDVKAGQLLATLDLTEINSQLAQADLSVQKADRDLQRAKKLYADTVATLETVQNAATSADFAHKTRDIVQFNQRFSEIRAPRSGKILKKLISEGELSGPGIPVFFINEATANTNDWVVRVGVSDRDWAVLRVGNAANISFDAYPNETFAGKITKLADYVDVASGTYEVEISLNTKGKRMATGLFAHTKLQPSASSLMQIIPIEALVEGNGTSGYVWVIEETLHATSLSVKKMPVKIVQILEKEVGISGLTTNAVITDGSAFLTEKTKVKLLGNKE